VVRDTRVIGLAAAGITLLLWSGFMLLSRFGLTSDFRPLDLAALRLGVAGVIMLPLFVGTGLRRIGLARGLFLAATGGLGFTLGAFYGFTLAPAAHGAVLLPGVLPLFTALLVVVYLGERLSRARLACLGLIVAGVVVLALGSFAWEGPLTLLGDASFLGASFSWALFTVALRRWQVEPFAGVAVVSVLSAALYLPLYLLLPGSGLAAVPWPALVVQGIYQGVVAVVVALYTFSVAVRHLGPAGATMVTAAAPAVVTVAAWLLLDEAISPAVLAGVVLVITGGVSSVFVDRR
jgi:drug/metabolite transporter (DMT)-like permease